MGFTVNDVQMIKYADKIPYVFVLDHLLAGDLMIKPMFGCFGVYVGNKLCLFLIDRKTPIGRSEGEPMENGVYIATTGSHETDLRPIFPDVDFQGLKGDKAWIFVPVDHPRFEEHVVKACEMISDNDKRIGR